MKHQELLQLIEQAAAEQWEELDLSGRYVKELPPEIGELKQLRKLILGKRDKDGRLRGNYLESLPEDLVQLVQLEELSVAGCYIRVLPAWCAQLEDLQVLDISNSYIRELPEWLSQLRHLRELNLNNTSYIRQLPEWLGQLSNLQSLDIGSNKLNELPEWLGQLSNLQSLDIGSNKLNELPEWLGQLSNLQSLDIGDNKLNELPEWLGQLSNLQSLDISSNNLNELPEWLGQLSNLQSLNIGDNKLNKLPEWLGQLSNLQSLDIGFNKLNKLPEWLGQLSNLQSLNIGSNKLNELPEWLGQLSNLQSLDIGDNNLNKLPEWLGQFSNLQSLDIGFNNLNELPEWLGQLSNLQSLDIGFNNLNKLPEWLGQLFNLQSLYIGSNNLNKLPEWLRQFSNLQSLDIGSNNLNKLPEWLGQFSNLQSLDIGSNNLNELPEWLRQLSNLQSLDISSNNLNELPEWLGQLSNLQSLDISSNNLNELPEWLGQLSNLQSLYLEKNKIRTLPIQLAQLSNLRRLVSKGNPIKDIPPEILRKGWGEKTWKNGEPQIIFDYLTTVGKRPLNELKLLLVGEGDVGKTSVLKRLVNKEFNPQENKTPGINIVKGWKVPQGDPNIRLNLWDFGGQRVMHATHQFFLTKRSLYLLVLDNRKNEQQNRVEYWLKLIETYGGDSPVIIVGNCADESSLDVKKRTLRKKYPQVKAFVQTSCKTGEGIRKLYTEIAQQIDNIPHVRDLLKNSWFEIKDQLEAMQSQYDFISYEKYQNFCIDSAITDSQDQKNLVGFLHDLGIVINFQDDPRLNDTNVLNPEWVTSGIYDILNNQRLMVQQKGVLKLPDLNSILEKPARYPANKRRFLMDLMGKFELCFKFSEYTPEQYLITDLLPIDEPDVDIYEKAPLHFRYRYDILPSSIISRFIVRNHNMIYRNMRWRSGVVLHQDLNKALVRADEEDNFISIKVTGSRAASLLGAIRADFTKIHNTISLPVRERLVIREVDNDQPTGREVPVDYNYLCDLDRKGTVETPLPDLRGSYNIRDLLEGVESQEKRQENLEDRLERSRDSRSSRPLDTLEKPPQKPGIIKTTAVMLVVLAAIAAIFAILANFVPELHLFITIIAVLIAFAVLALVVLRITDIISEEAFNKALTGFWDTIPQIPGQKTDSSGNNSENDSSESDN